MLEENAMNVSSVVSPSFICIYFKCMKDLTLERDPMSAKTVVKPLHVTVPFEDMEKHIPERGGGTFMNAKHARMFRIFSSLQIMEVLGKDLMNVKQMAKALGFFLCLLTMERLGELTGENSVTLRDVLRSSIPFEDMKISGVKAHE